MGYIQEARENHVKKKVEEGMFKSSKSRAHKSLLPSFLSIFLLDSKCTQSVGFFFLLPKQVYNLVCKSLLISTEEQNEAEGDEGV